MWQNFTSYRQTFKALYLHVVMLSILSVPLHLICPTAYYRACCIMPGLAGSLALWFLGVFGDLDAQVSDLWELFLWKVFNCVCMNQRSKCCQSKIKIQVLKMSLIREGRNKLYFESCGSARPSHMCVHKQANTHPHFPCMQYDLLDNPSSSVNRNCPWNVFLYTIYYNRTSSGL